MCDMAPTLPGAERDVEAATPAPALDGNHTLRAEILSHEGTLITREDRAVIIDRQPPVMSGGFAFLGGWPNNHDPLEPEALVSGYSVARIVAHVWSSCIAQWVGGSFTSAQAIGDELALAARLLVDR